MSGEVTIRETADMSAEIRGYLERQQDIMLAMAGTIKAACEKIDRLEAQIKRMEKVTPEQVTRLNALIRAHAEELCKEYGMLYPYGGKNDAAKQVGAMIRADIKKRYGALVRDLCRMDAGMCEEFIKMWEDTPRLLRLRRKQDEAGL